MEPLLPPSALLGNLFDVALVGSKFMSLFHPYRSATPLGPGSGKRVQRDANYMSGRYPCGRLLPVSDLVFGRDSINISPHPTRNLIPSHRSQSQAHTSAITTLNPLLGYSVDQSRRHIPVESILSLQELEKMARSFALVAVVVALLVAFSCSAVASARILTEKVAVDYSQHKHGLPSFAKPSHPKPTLPSFPKPTLPSFPKPTLPSFAKPSHTKPTLPKLPSLPSCSPPPPTPVYSSPPPPAGGY